MNSVNRLPRAADATTLAVTTTTATAACPGPRQPGPASYHLAPGDSLSQGAQPDAADADAETPQRYPDIVYARLRPGHPALKLAQLRCPDEPTLTMIRGGIGHAPPAEPAAGSSLTRCSRPRAWG